MKINKVKSQYLMVSGPTEYHRIDGTTITDAYLVQSTDGTEIWDVDGPFKTESEAMLALEEAESMVVEPD